MPVVNIIVFEVFRSYHKQAGGGDLGGGGGCLPLFFQSRNKNNGEFGVFRKKIPATPRPLKFSLRAFSADYLAANFWPQKLFQTDFARPPLRFYPDTAPANKHAIIF